MAMAEERFSLPNLDLSALPGPETIHRRVLSNGITLLVRENFASPSVVLSGFLPVGSLAETEETAGLAYLTALALMRGTRQHTFSEIFESLESIGARLNVGAGVHSTSFHGKSLAEDLGLLLTLLAEVLASPRFPKQEVERLKAQHLTSLTIREQDTGAQAELAFDSLVYARHPYRLPSDGTLASVAGLQTADLRRFHRSYYSPQGMVLSIVGAVPADHVLPLAEGAFGAWQAEGAQAMPSLPPLKRLRSTKRAAVRLAGKQQSDVIIGVAGPARMNEDFLAAALGNNILGRFGMMGRIGDAVRVSAGLAYYAYSLVSGGLGPGPWQIIAGVNPANEAQAIDLIVKEIRRFTSKRVGSKELLENKANFIGRLPMQLESNEGVAGALAHIERYELGLDYYQRYPALITAITRDQILETAQRYLDPGRLAIVTAGPVEKKD
jgi:zinc protease